jgi:DNA-binding NarL/FixJ family response regulator
MAEKCRNVNLMKTITVLLCDDHTVFRQGLRRLLEAADDIEVIGDAEDGHQAVDETKRLQPDVVLMDVAMPLLNGVEAARKITREFPATKVLILSNYSDDQHVQGAVKAGAAGYLMKQAAAEDLLRAIREVYEGNACFSPPIARRLLTQQRNPQFESAPALSSRQTEVVQLIAEGYSSPEIAGLLSLSLKTVEKHRQALMDKLGIHEIASLTCYAVASGVVESNQSPFGPSRRFAAQRMSPLPRSEIARGQGQFQPGRRDTQTTA